MDDMLSLCNKVRAKGVKFTMINIAVTIDVENPQTPLFEKKFSDNRIWSEGYGIEKIIEILDKYGVKGSFFTNVYEYPIWGKSEMERIVKFIHDKGHDVELHTHPIWIDEKRRENMFQFPLREQESIIQWGADFIEKCTGRRPICHRAGAYGFDSNTLKACRKNGILADSSNFYGHPNCRSILTKNEIINTNEVIELPVTCFARNGQNQKTDLDWMREDEFHQFFEYVKSEPRLNFINLFFHSYSLTRSENNFHTFSPFHENIAKLEHILTRLCENENYDVLALNDIAGQFKNNNKDELISDSVKQTKSKITYQPTTETRHKSALQLLLHQNQTERILVFVNTNSKLIKLREIEKLNLDIMLTSVNKNVISGLKKQNNKILDLKELNYSYMNEQVGGYALYSYSGERWDHYLNFDTIFHPFISIPAVKYWKNYDLYEKGDYNSAFSLGSQILYLIDLIVALIEQSKPTMIVSLDEKDKAQTLESLILQDLKDVYNFKLYVLPIGQ